jgi:hypothetical protein
MSRIGRVGKDSAPANGSGQNYRRAAKQRDELAAFHCPVPPVLPDRKDSTPRHGRLLHPSSWAERDDRDHAAKNFFQGGSPKQATPLPHQQPPSPPKIVLRQISGDGAWMKI